MTDAEQQVWTECGRLNRATQVAYLRYLGTRLDATIMDEPDALSIRCDIPANVFNAVIASSIEPALLHVRVSELLRPFFERNLPCCWWRFPQDTPAGLDLAIKQRGLFYRTVTTMMTATADQAPLDEPMPSGLDIVPVTSLAGLEHFIRPFRQGFRFTGVQAKAWFVGYRRVGLEDSPPLCHLVGLLGDAPVACATVFVANGVGGLMNIATAPAWRRRGIGRAMTIAAVQKAVTFGASTVVLQATAAGLPVYQRLGFEACGEMSYYQ